MLLRCFPATGVTPLLLRRVVMPYAAAAMRGVQTPGKMRGQALTPEDMERFAKMKAQERDLEPDEIPQGPTHMNEDVWGEHLVKKMRAKAERAAAADGQTLNTENPVPPQMENIRELGDIERHPVTFRVQLIHAIPFLYLIYLTVQFMVDPFDDGERYTRYRDRVSGYIS